MNHQRHRSLFQFDNPDGSSPRLENFPNLRLETIEQQATAKGRDWQTELGMPTYFEEWEQMARFRSTARRGDLKFVVADESQTNLPGHPRLQPKLLSLTTVCPLELAHSGFIVGMVYAYVLGIEEGRYALPPWLTLTLPQTKGDTLVACAQFIDSPMAEKAIEGLRRKIFTHICPTVFRPDGAPEGSGAVLQVSLVPGDFPGIENARVFSFTE